MSSIVALDVGGTQLRAAVYPGSGITPTNVIRAATLGMEPDVLKRLIELIETIWPTDVVDAISVAAPGPLNPYTGVIITTPNIPSWDGLPLASILTNHFKVPTYLGNDANLAALGEWKFGAGQEHHDLLYLTISTGIGGGVISKDVLIEGSRGMATELGHITVQPGGPICTCGIRGHLEAVASGKAIVDYVLREIAIGRPSILKSIEGISAREIATAALNGDELAIDTFNQAGRFIGQALADYLHIFNPSIVILGGGVTRSGKLILDPILDSIRSNVMDKSYLNDLQVVTAQLGDDAGLLGALAQGRMHQ